jgi:5'-nucleotidase
VSPFDNYPSIVPLTGAQITDALRRTSTGGPGILQVSGLRYVIDEARDRDKPIPQRDRLVSVTLPNGQPIDANAVYRVAMPDFLASGGEGLGPIMSTSPADRMTTDRSVPLHDIFIAALQKWPMPLQPATDGRITVVNPQQSSAPEP